MGGEQGGGGGVPEHSPCGAGPRERGRPPRGAVWKRRRAAAGPAGGAFLYQSHPRVVGCSTQGDACPSPVRPPPPPHPHRRHPPSARRVAGRRTALPPRVPPTPLPPPPPLPTSAPPLAPPVCPIAAVLAGRHGRRDPPTWGSDAPPRPRLPRRDGSGGGVVPAPGAEAPPPPGGGAAGRIDQKYIWGGGGGAEGWRAGVGTGGGKGVRRRRPPNRETPDRDAAAAYIEGGSRRGRRHPPPRRTHRLQRGRGDFFSWQPPAAAPGQPAGRSGREIGTQYGAALELGVQKTGSARVRHAVARAKIPLPACVPASTRGRPAPGAQLYSVPTRLWPWCLQ